MHYVGRKRILQAENKMTEQQWDKKLKIQTCGRDDTNADAYNHPYEPTPYAVLERLAESGYIKPENTLVDYGCGKGRVGFFLHEVVGCNVIGIEHDEHIWRAAEENLKSGKGTSKISFLLQKAEDFLCTDADCFYFFNPFSADILHAVISRIADSYYDSPRIMRLFFYYPHDDYLRLLLAGSDGISGLIWFLDEIDCRDIFGTNDERERIMIFEIGGQ